MPLTYVHHPVKLVIITLLRAANMVAGFLTLMLKDGISAALDAALADDYAAIQ